MRSFAAIALMLVLHAAVAEPITPERKAALDAFIASQDLERVWSNVIEQAAMGIPGELAKGARRGVSRRTDLTDDQKARVLAAIDSVSGNMTKEVAGEFAKVDVAAAVHEMVYQVYGSRFSTAEIRTITAFYSSPVGNKTLRLMPAIVAEEKDGKRGAMERYFSPAEQQEIMRFLQSPLSRRMHDPQLLAEERSIAERYTQPLQNRIVQGFFAKVESESGVRLR